jgi:hypothetical protein
MAIKHRNNVCTLYFFPAVLLQETDTPHSVVRNIMEELEIWFYNNNLMIKTGKTIAMSFHTKQKRYPLRPQVIFKNMDIAYKSELKFLGIYITENL